MTTPKRIRFMGYTFRVVQETEHTEDEERYGLIDYRTQTIQLNRNTSDERKQETLVHELIHLVLDFTKVELEEDDVGRLGHGLYAILKENGLLRG